ncbi:MAG TPA: hypothetical protein DIU00_22475 [Phycisphaerales bacterium]|nr:hypothetical protein [Phycisphaerales bacterium]
MSWWLNWIILLFGTVLVFVIYGWLSPLPLWLDRHWNRGNDIGRPLLDTLVITGLPALYAKLAHTPWPGALIPITFFLTQYAVLSGRFLVREFNVAGWVMLHTTLAIWIVFFVT